MVSDGKRHPLYWPIETALEAGAAALFSWGLLWADRSTAPSPDLAPEWGSPNRVVLETAALKLRQFGGGSGPPVVVVTPFALHGAVVADLAPGHSIVERLLAEGVDPVLLVEWVSATPELRYLRIDDYLAQLAVVLDDVGGPAALVGLCQGGWLSLMCAARFPPKVSRLVLAGSPVDLDAAPSRMVERARSTPREVVGGLVASGDGLVLGNVAKHLWGIEPLGPAAIADVLQVPDPEPDLLERFRAWYGWTLDLPGAYYVEVVDDLFRSNALARGAYRALGRTLDLSVVRVPLFLLGSDEDEVTAPEQVFAAGRHVGTPPEGVETRRVAGSHLSLFLGARTLASGWRDVARWIRA